MDKSLGITLKMANSVIYFNFSGWGLRMIYKSDFFEKSIPPMGFKDSQIEIFTEIVLYFTFEASP